jgi:hypothetical protein
MFRMVGVTIRNCNLRAPEPVFLTGAPSQNGLPNLWSRASHQNLPAQSPFEIDFSRAEFVNVTFANCEGHRAGAVRASESMLTFTGVIFANNVGTRGGAGHHPTLSFDWSTTFFVLGS